MSPEPKLGLLRESEKFPGNPVAMRDLVEQIADAKIKGAAIGNTADLLKLLKSAAPRHEENLKYLRLCLGISPLSTWHGYTADGCSAVFCGGFSETKDPFRGAQVVMLAERFLWHGAVGFLEPEYLLLLRELRISLCPFRSEKRVVSVTYTAARGRGREQLTLDTVGLSLSREEYQPFAASGSIDYKDLSVPLRNLTTGTTSRFSRAGLIGLVSEQMGERAPSSHQMVTLVAGGVVDYVHLNKDVRLDFAGRSRAAKISFPAIGVSENSCSQILLPSLI